MSALLALPTDLTRRYRYHISRDFRFGRWEISYNLVGVRGGVNLHAVRLIRPEGDAPFAWSGGLEFHFRAAPSGREGEPPDHDECWLLHCPCWHEGSGLIVNEVYAPLLEEGREDDILRRLIRDADRYLLDGSAT